MVHSAQKWIIGSLISAIAAVLVFDLGIEDWHMVAGRLHSTTFVPLLLSAAGLALAVGVIGHLSRVHDSNSLEIFLEKSSGYLRRRFRLSMWMKSTARFDNEKRRYTRLHRRFASRGTRLS